MSYALLLCFGVKVHDSGAGPKNISEIFTQSRLSPLAKSVSAQEMSNSICKHWTGRTQLVASFERRGSVIEPARKNLQEADRHIAVLE